MLLGKRFSRFSKNGQFNGMRNTVGKTKKYPKWHDFDHPNIVLRASSNVQNRFGMDSKVRRTHFQHYFEFFVTKIPIHNFFYTAFRTFVTKLNGFYKVRLQKCSTGLTKRFQAAAVSLFYRSNHASDDYNFVFVWKFRALPPPYLFAEFSYDV